MNEGAVTETTTIRRGGRPSREQAERLGEQILDVATELFLRDGYGATSIEAIAQVAGISKRTFYHRFDGKPALFGAVVHRIVAGLHPPSNVPLLAGGTLEEILTRLGGMILDAAMTTQALALNRLIVAEATRFPELASTLAGQGASQEAIDLIGGLLTGDLAPARIGPGDAAFAARQFLQMIVSWPQRLALAFGHVMSVEERTTWVRQSTKLLLGGCFG